MCERTALLCATPSESPARPSAVRTRTLAVDPAFTDAKANESARTATNTPRLPLSRCRPKLRPCPCVPKRPTTHGHSRPHAVLPAPRTTIRRDEGNSRYQVGSQADIVGPITAALRLTQGESAAPAVQQRCRSSAIGTISQSYSHLLNSRWRRPCPTPHQFPAVMLDCEVCCRHAASVSTQYSAVVIPAPAAARMARQWVVNDPLTESHCYSMPSEGAKARQVRAQHPSLALP